MTQEANLNLTISLHHCCLWCHLWICDGQLFLWPWLIVIATATLLLASPSDSEWRSIFSQLSFHFLQLVDNETCVRFAVWWSDSDQAAALKVKLNVLNRTQLHHSRVSLAGCQLRLWQLQILSDISPPSRDISRWYLLDISRLRQDITATRRTMLFCFKQCTLQQLSAPTMLSVAGLHLNPVCRVFPVFHVDLVERRGYWRER